MMFYLPQDVLGEVGVSRTVPLSAKLQVGALAADAMVPLQFSPILQFGRRGPGG